jgi:drug/metabolite transporter (DMT)-like permease
MDNNKVKGHAAVLMANVVFGLNVPVTKALLNHWMTPLGYMGTRSLFAVLLFWIIQCFTPKEHVEKRDLLLIIVGGFMGFIISQYLTAVSLGYTSPVYFSLIAALSPIVVMLLAAIFLKEPITKYKTFGVILGITGVVLMITMGNSVTVGSNDLLGIILAIFSIMAYSVYLIIMRSVSQKYSAVTQMKWMFLFTAIILVPLGANEYTQQAIYSSDWNWDGILELAFVLVFATSVGYFLMPFGMKFLRATTVGVYMNLQPIVASLVAIFIGQDAFSWDKPVAAILVLLGAYVVTTNPIVRNHKNGTK